MKTTVSATSPAPRANPRIGYLFAVLNAIISGFAIYINSLGVKPFSDSTLYTTLKNAVVGVALLIPVLLIARQRAELRRLNPRQWGWLVLLAIVGGSVPYVLFFRGLQLTSPVTSSLINHAQFLIVAVLALVLLSERVGPWVWGGLAVLLVGVSFGTNLGAVRWNDGALLVAASTVFFAVGFVLAKRLLASLSTVTVMAAKMSLGSLFLVVYVGTTGHLNAITRLSTTQWLYALATGLILLAFTVTAFIALRHATATAATAIPAAAPIITSALVALAAGQIKISPANGIGLALMLVAVVTIVYFGQRRERRQQAQQQAMTSAEGVAVA
jgi:drug/metabolite transporter (DMT)-like permease